MSDKITEGAAAMPSPEATGAGTPPANELQATLAALKAMGDRLDLLVAQTDESNRISQERERIVDRLHADVQALRQGELQQAMAPLLRDLIKLFDDLDHVVARSAVENDDRPAAGTLITGYRDDVGDILFRYGIERYDAAEGTPFDPKEHRAVATIATPLAEQDGRLARIARTGFRSGARIVRPLEAHVFRHVETASKPAPPTSTE